VGVPIQRETEAPLGPKTRGEENGEGDSMVWESVKCELSQSQPGPGRAPVKNGFIVI